LSISLNKNIFPHPVSLSIKLALNCLESLVSLPQVFPPGNFGEFSSNTFLLMTTELLQDLFRVFSENPLLKGDQWERERGDKRG
jgi:hypothetical protein